MNRSKNREPTKTLCSGGGRKGDAAHIHGSPFMSSFSHASSTKDLPGWYLLSRYQSCRCAFDSFRKGSGLHSFRTCAGRSPEQSGTADLCVHRDAQSLAFCCQTEEQESSNRFLSVADAYPHNALARSLPHRRNGASLPRAIQGLSDSGRWSSPSSYPLRRAQCLAC